MDVVLVQPGGFCAGAVRAAETVELALGRHRVPIRLPHHTVRNRHAVGGLRLLPELCRPSSAGAQATAGMRCVAPGASGNE